jgi:hypothetical protein
VIDDRTDHFIGAVQQEEPETADLRLGVAGITRVTGGATLRLDDYERPPYLYRCTA